MRNLNKFPIDKKRIEPLPLSPVRNIGVKTFAGFDQRREHVERTAFGLRFPLFPDRAHALFFARQIAIRLTLRSALGHHQPPTHTTSTNSPHVLFSATA